MSTLEKLAEDCFEHFDFDGVVTGMGGWVDTETNHWLKTVLLENDDGDRQRVSFHVVFDEHRHTHPVIKECYSLSLAYGAMM